MPGMLRSTAEHVDLVQSLDRWVFTQAIGLVTAQAAHGLVCTPDINLFTKSLQEESLLEFIDARLAATGINPSCLVFEITETAAIESIVKVSAELGYRTIAEYVGDDCTLDLLRSCGVDLAQGFHLGRPAPVADVFAWQLIPPRRQL